MVKIASITLALWLTTPFRAFANQTLKTDELPPDTLIVMRRGACERRCSVYDVMIFSDASVIFNGRSYVRRAGLVRSQIPRETVGDLLDKAARLQFFDLRPRYARADNDCNSSKSDAPTVMLSISSGGKSKTVMHNLGCSGGTLDQLKQLEDEVDKAVQTDRWVK